MENANPAPKFDWYIEDEKLENTKVYPGPLSQTLELDLSADYINQTLRCEAIFEQLDDLTLNATADLRYNYDETREEDIIDIIPVIEVDGLDITPIIVGISVGIFILAVMVYVCSRYGFCCFKNSTVVDAEKGDKVTLNNFTNFELSYFQQIFLF